MTGLNRGEALLALLTALAATACGAARTGVEPAPGPDAIGSVEIEALYRARMDSARTRFTEADVRFMTAMIGHHAQAVVMARLAPERGGSPAVQTLAARILRAQQDEIALMQQWLRQRRQPAPEVHIEGAKLMLHGVGHGHADHASEMPGMLSDEQLRELERARGAEFDRLFLSYMIQHHRGAVTMVRELFGTDGAGQDATVFKFASDVQVDQTSEVARMERMLLEMSPPGSLR